MSMRTLGIMSWVGWFAVVMMFGAPATQAEKPYRTAVLGFQEKGKTAQGMGARSAQLLMQELRTNAHLQLVERRKIEKIQQEQNIKLGTSVNQANALEIGRRANADLVVVGLVMDDTDYLYWDVRIISTKTKRMDGASVQASIDGSPSVHIPLLGEKLHKVIREEAANLQKPIDPVEETASSDKTEKTPASEDEENKAPASEDEDESSSSDSPSS